MTTVDSRAYSEERLTHTALSGATNAFLDPSSRKYRDKIARTSSFPIASSANSPNRAVTNPVKGEAKNHDLWKSRHAAATRGAVAAISTASRAGFRSEKPRPPPLLRHVSSNASQAAWFARNRGQDSSPSNGPPLHSPSNIAAVIAHNKSYESLTSNTLESPAKIPAPARTNPGAAALLASTKFSSVTQPATAIAPNQILMHEDTTPITRHLEPTREFPLPGTVDHVARWLETLTSTSPSHASHPSVASTTDANANVEEAHRSLPVFSRSQKEVSAGLGSTAGSSSDSVFHLQSHQSTHEQRVANELEPLYGVDSRAIHASKLQAASNPTRRPGQQSSLSSSHESYEDAVDLLPTSIASKDISLHNHNYDITAENYNELLHSTSSMDGLSKGENLVRQLAEVEQKNEDAVSYYRPIPSPPLFSHVDGNLVTIMDVNDRPLLKKAGPDVENSQRQRQQQLITHLTGESLTSAIIASSLASSRAPSPAKSPTLRASRVHMPFEHFHTPHTAKSLRSRSPAKDDLYTMRKRDPVADDEFWNSGYQRQRSRFSLRRHPHMHHEGDRKRWREELTVTERKRYEGVWAANKGLFLPHDVGDAVAHTVDSQNRLVCNLVVREIWNRSRLPTDVLAEVWDLVDREGQGRLDKEEFVVGLWLIDQRLKGRKLPTQVKESVWASVRGLEGIEIPKIKRNSR